MMGFGEACLGEGLLLIDYCGVVDLEERHA